jgi:capsular polysaccharide biosynthesis protein
MERDEQFKEINLMEYIEILWKKKWLIIIPTILISIAVGIWSFLQTPVWEVDAIIQPSKFFYQNTAGEFVEVIVADPKQVAGQINQASYNRIIADELNIDLRAFPVLKAENMKDTKLVRVVVRDTDAERASKILNSLFHHLKSDFDRRIDVEIKSIDTQIIDKENQIKGNDLSIKDKENQIELTKLSIKDKENQIEITKYGIKDKENAIKNKDNEIKKRNNDITTKDLDIQSRGIEKDRINKGIETNKNKLKISEDRAAGILDEMKSVKMRIDEIEKQLQKALAEKAQGTDAIVLLLYSNEIQQNLRYYETLDEKISAEKITRENLNLEIRDKEEQLRQIDNQIHQVETQKDTIKTDIDNITNDTAVIKTGIEKINTEIIVMRNDIVKTNTEIIVIRNDINKTINTSNTLKSDIQFLGNKKARIDFASLIKEPTASLNPVAPKKKMNVLIAGFVSLVVFCCLVLFLNYLKKNQSSQS